MAVSHVKSNAVADVTGTVTVYNSAGATATAAATNLVRPVDWNSAHNQYVTISGATAGQSTASGTNLVFAGTNGVTLALSTAANAATMHISGGGAAGGGATLQEFWSPPTGQFQGNLNSAPGQGSFSLFPVTALQNFYGSEIDLFASMSLGTQTNTSSAYFRATFVGGMYVMANTTSLALVSSTTASMSYSWGSNTGRYVSGSGARVLSFPWDVYMTPGIYYMGCGLSTNNNATNTSTATTALGNTITLFGMMTRSSEMASGLFAALPQGIAVGNANANNHARFFGYLNSTYSSGPPATIGTNQVSNTGTAPLRAGIVVRLRNV